MERRKWNTISYEMRVYRRNFWKAPFKNWNTIGTIRKNITWYYRSIDAADITMSSRNAVSWYMLKLSLFSSFTFSIVKNIVKVFWLSRMWRLVLSNCIIILALGGIFNSSHLCTHLFPNNNFQVSNKTQRFFDIKRNINEFLFVNWLDVRCL